MLANLLRRINDVAIPFQNPPIVLDNPNAYGTSQGDQFGWSVAVSGNRVIVGAHLEDDASGNTSGKAYIFDVATGILLHVLHNPNPFGTSANDSFGRFVDISGNYAIVGAHLEDEQNRANSGKAYIFEVSSGNLLWTLNNPNAYGRATNDNFGWSVSISDTHAIVGAQYEDDDDGTNSGKAYIFNVTTGALLHILNNPNAYGSSKDDNFGRCVSISGNYVIVGAPLEDEQSRSNSGKAYIFNVTTGALVRTLHNPNAYGSSKDDNFGTSVHIFNNYAIVGAPLEDDAGGTSSGKAYIFNVTTGALLHILNNPNAYGSSKDDNFGRNVAISDEYAVVGAYLEDELNNEDSGKIYIFDVITGSLFKTIDNPNVYGTAANDHFGYDVDISGPCIVTGADQEGDSGGTLSGKAYIFT